MSEDGEELTQKRVGRIWEILVCLAAVALAFPVWNFGSLNLDRVLFSPGPLTVERLLEAWTTAPGGDWRPVTRTIFLLWSAVDSPFAVLLMRLGSMVLHAACGLVVYRSLGTLLHSRLAAAGVALLFLVHPQRVEAVAWISAQGTLWGTLAALGSLWCFVKSLSGGWRWTLSAVLLLFLSLLSAEVALFLPLVFILIAVADGKRPWRGIPYFALPMLVCWFAWQAGQGALASDLDLGKAWDLSRAFVQIPAVYTWQLFRTVVPVGFGWESGKAIHRK